MISYLFWVESKLNFASDNGLDWLDDSSQQQRRSLFVSSYGCCLVSHTTAVISSFGWLQKESTWAGLVKKTLSTVWYFQRINWTCTAQIQSRATQAVCMCVCFHVWSVCVCMCPYISCICPNLKTVKRYCIEWYNVDENMLNCIKKIKKNKLLLTFTEVFSEKREKHSELKQKN